MFHTNILNLPEHGGLGIKLDLVYRSSQAITRRALVSDTYGVYSARQSSYLNPHILGLGWFLDLPVIYHDAVYVP